jgi:hypothetical protein
MPIDKAIVFAGLQQLPNGRAAVEFALKDERGNPISTWSVTVAAQASADACIERARRQVLEEMRVIVRLADAD